jgi:hypothetical protein
MTHSTQVFHLRHHQNRQPLLCVSYCIISSICKESKISFAGPLFSTMHHSTTSTDLKLFQTMANTQPFNNEFVFLARNLKVN